MVHLRLEWLRVVEGADHNVDLAWQPLVLVRERCPAIAAEGPADAMGRLIDLRRPCSVSTCSEPYPAKGETGAPLDLRQSRQWQ